MEKNNNKPKLRFPGFTDHWEQRKLGDESIEIVAGGDIDKNKVVDSGRYPVLANALINDGIVGYYNDDFRIKAPAVTVTGRGDVGHAKARYIDFTPVVRLLSVKTKHDVNFLENAINNHKVLVESTGVPQLTVPQLSKYEIYFPKTDNEEKVIGLFFKNLDNLITLHQRKLKHLQDKKKSLLQKMFPRNGEDFPELRFPEFTDAWEQRKLGEICEEFQSGKNIKAEDIKENGAYPVYGANGFRGYSDTYNHDGIYALIGRQGALCGNMNISSGKAYFTEHAIAVRANKSNETRFLFYLLGKMNLGQYSGQSAQPGLAVNKLLKLSSSVPNYDEQKQISEFLVLFDNLITLHQRKLKHLQEQKKALLQQMFI